MFPPGKSAATPTPPPSGTQDQSTAAKEPVSGMDMQADTPSPYRPKADEKRDPATGLKFIPKILEPRTTQRKRDQSLMEG